VSRVFERGGFDFEVRAIEHMRAGEDHGVSDEESGDDGVGILLHHDRAKLQIHVEKGEAAFGGDFLVSGEATVGVVDAGDQSAAEGRAHAVGEAIVGHPAGLLQRMQAGHACEVAAGPERFAVFAGEFGAKHGVETGVAGFLDGENGVGRELKATVGGEARPIGRVAVDGGCGEKFVEDRAEVGSFGGLCAEFIAAGGFVHLVGDHDADDAEHHPGKEALLVARDDDVAGLVVVSADRQLAHFRHGFRRDGDGLRFFGRGVVLDAFERGATGEGRGDEESEHGAVGAAQREDGMRE
jgi:hypothetical protein